MLNAWDSAHSYRSKLTVRLWERSAAARYQTFPLIGTLFLLPIIFIYTGWSYWVFRGKAKIEMGYD